ncbi:MAG: hypothetical protein A3E01_03720 [Gammaproteobacteria bacterium RIFCSPHIGHO2_12_FULL_63_22]|nr:MAG: hypothetical protein A3E01_03720 [Gammaproteobacteria bacterium RIFCSPHIGHO2_12_FULL_63_22]
MIIAWCAAQLLLVITAVQLMGSSVWRRAASILVLGTSWVLPLSAPDVPLLRAVLAAVAILALVKVVQLAVHPEPDRWAPLKRLWHGLAPFDVADTERVAPVLDKKLLLAVTLHAGLAVLALVGLFYLPRESGIGTNLARLGLGITLAYSGMETISESIRLLHLLGGIAVSPIQRSPILAQSIREFWSERWNLPVNGWLETLVFRPVNERFGPGTGVMAAFTVSGLLHGWMFLVSIGIVGAVMGFAFFAFNGMFVLVETMFRLRQVAEWKRRAWTLGMLGMASPLYIEPGLQVLGL